MPDSVRGGAAAPTKCTASRVQVKLIAMLRNCVKRAMATAVAAMTLLANVSALAQYPPAPYPSTAPGYPPPPPGYRPPAAPGYPGGYAPMPPRRTSSGLEIGFLYGTSATWGLGTGIWIDAEAKVSDPGIAFIAPLVLGAAAPLGVFLTDRYAFRQGMPEGLPSAIATGMLIGAGEGLGIAGYQWVSSSAEDAWGFRGLARAEVLGSTVGGVAGAALYYLTKPLPETNLMIASSAFWGASIGSFFGGGASGFRASWSDSNDAVALGGLIGFNTAVAATVAASIFWTPSWNNLAWMWGGYGIGTAGSSLVYIFYAASDDHDPRRGLIFQGAAGLVGIGLGAAFSRPRRRNGFASNPNPHSKDWIQLWGANVAPMGMQGLGVQLNGALR